MDFVLTNNINTKLLDKLKKLKRIIKLDNNFKDVDASHIENHNTNTVVKYVNYTYNDFIISQYYLNYKDWYLNKNN